MRELTNDYSRVKILIFSASLRRDSLNARLAALAMTVVRERGGTVEQAAMADFDCPSYNQDVERSGGVPAGAQRLRERLIAADAFIIASPEYNASMPGALKNSIDWSSRFQPQPFNGRQGLLLSASPSMGRRQPRPLVAPYSARVPRCAHLSGHVFACAGAPVVRRQRAHRQLHLQHRFERTIECFMDLVEAATHYPVLKKQWVEFLGERPDAAIDREQRRS